MIAGQAMSILLQTTARTIRRSLLKLGGFGLIPLGLLDSSIVPIPGSMDIVTIILSARQQEWWLYYALMATAGSVIGGFVTYRLARKGGKEMLERRFARRQVDIVYEKFGRWGFGAIAIPALLPPPVPMVPFLFAAGAMQYPVRKFLGALTLGRTARYMILAFLAARYGRRIIVTMLTHGGLALAASIVVLIAVMTGLAFFFFWRGSNSKGRVPG